MWDVELAKMFKERDNQENIGPIVGKVINPLPDMKITIFEDQVILNVSHLYICNAVDNTEFESTDIIGQEVLLIPTSNDQKFFVIDKVRKLG